MPRTPIPLKMAQAIFLKAGRYTGKVDGLEGPKTRAAVGSYGTTDRTLAAQRALNHEIAADLKEDGAFGPATEAAAELYLETENWREVSDPVGHKLGRWPTYSGLRSFYGAPGTGHVIMTLPYPMRIAWDTSKSVRRITVHEKCKESFEYIFSQTLDHYGMTGIVDLGLDLFGGCYNNRKMRGSAKLSTHAYACAIDLDPIRNQLRWGKDRARLAKSDAVPFWKIVEETGMVSLGRVKNYDWMHFQGCAQ